MEIFSVRSSQSWLFKEKAPATRPADTGFTSLTQAKPVFEVEEPLAEKPDFGNINAGDLRRLARQSYDRGAIDGETFATISEPLPMHTIDTQGNILDLSGISDATTFNFRDYYRDRLQIAKSIGDPQSVQRLSAVVDFVERG